VEQVDLVAEAVALQALAQAVKAATELFIFTTKEKKGIYIAS
jgi:hypothetical protein